MFSQNWLNPETEQTFFILPMLSWLLWFYRRRDEFVCHTGAHVYVNWKHQRWFRIIKGSRMRRNGWKSEVERFQTVFPPSSWPCIRLKTLALFLPFEFVPVAVVSSAVWSNLSANTTIYQLLCRRFGLWLCRDFLLLIRCVLGETDAQPLHLCQTVSAAIVCHTQVYISKYICTSTLLLHP